MYKTGVVMGKFYPPHRGHKYLIDTAAGQVEHLTVLICDTPGQTISAALRACWIREIHPAVNAMVIDDQDDENDVRIWARNTISRLGQAPSLCLVPASPKDPQFGWCDATCAVPYWG